MSLTLLIGLGMGWYVDHCRQKEESFRWFRTVLAIEHAMMYHGIEINQRTDGVEITNRISGEQSFDPYSASASGWHRPIK
jgi:hypothetical protein